MPRPQPPGAAPRQVKDRRGRNVVALVESIRDTMPVTAELVNRRMALEQVSELLSGARHGSDGGGGPGSEGDKGAAAHAGAFGQ
jgi:hypothetical protein